MTKRVCLYARVSRQEQSCDRQLVELRELCENHGYTIVSEYVDEGISGGLKSRPALDKMLKDAMTRKFEMVITLELSRLGRSVQNMCEISALLKSKRIDLFVKNQNVDTSTIVGDFFFNIMNSVAQYEKDLIGERVRSGLESARKKGRIGGKKPVSNDVKKQILMLKSEGMSYRKIKSTLKVGNDTIKKVIDDELKRGLDDLGGDLEYAS
jgi:DNA invertase Pin-like site-specific DNA recombinase